MTIEIKKLDDTLIDEYIQFFDNMRLEHNCECGSCYCLFFHTPEKAPEWVKRDFSRNRSEAIQLIKQGKLSGFLAYYVDKPIAWCNVNEKNAYIFNKSRFEMMDSLNKDTVSIVCFYIQKNFRGKGVATELLNHVLNYYKQLQYKFIEAYPSTNKTSDSSNYHGPLSLFQKCNFTLISEYSETDDFGDYETYALMRYTICKQ